VSIVERTADTLVIEQRAAETVWFCLVFAACGVGIVTLGWFKGQWLFLLVGFVFVIVPLAMAVRARTMFHRFDRRRALVTIEARGLGGTKRRELPFAAIRDLMLDEMRVPQSGMRYRILYVTTGGERIEWTDFRQQKDDQDECLRAAREFLGLAGDARVSQAGGR
jgi:hypothetical protein